MLHREHRDNVRGKSGEINLMSWMHAYIQSPQGGPLTCGLVREPHIFHRFSFMVMMRMHKGYKFPHIFHTCTVRDKPSLQI